MSELKKVKITFDIDSELLSVVDETTSRLDTDRSKLIRNALRSHLRVLGVILPIETEPSVQPVTDIVVSNEDGLEAVELQPVV
jgi:hypothetical protein